MKTLTELLEIATEKGLAFETLADQANFINGFRTAEKIYTKGDEMNQIADIKKWFELAVPEPTEASKSIQIAIHFEEAGEMAAALNMDCLAGELEDTSADLKQGMPYDIYGEVDKKELLDSLCDQIVTAIGVAHMFGFDIVGALAEVNRSNFSKFVDGKPVFNAQGKIAKPDSYSPPVLDAFLGGEK